MIEDISKSIKANMYERATSPLFGSFAISWSIWNYKTVLTIFSSIKANEKILYIENEIYADKCSLLLEGVCYPLISAVLFILIYPYPAKWIYKYWNKQQKELKEIKQNIEDDTPLTLDESRKIRRDLLRYESYCHEELTKKDTEIDRLKDIISSLEDQAKQTSQTKSKGSSTTKKTLQPKIEDSINPDQELLLSNIAQFDGSVEFSDYLSRVPFDKVTSEYYLEDLELKGYLTISYSLGDRPDFIRLTTKGKKFAVDKGMVL